MNDLLQRVEIEIERRRLLAPGDAILVGVSGGFDSMVLMQVLARLAPRYNWLLTVGHFNHGLRGRSSDADQRLVERTAKQLGLEFISERADVRALARAAGISLEMAGRDCRHKFFARAAAEIKSYRLALAHHADDQVELFFLRLLRGAGGEGLAGMKWQTASAFADELRVIRPLLAESKSALRRFAEESRIRFREDATNSQSDIQRNRVRNELIPLLIKEYQPALSQVTLRAMDILGAETDLVAGVAEDWLRAAKRTPFAKLAVAVQRKCLQVQLIRLEVTPTFDLVEGLREGCDVPVAVNRDQVVCRDSGGLLHLKKLETTGFGDTRLTMSLEGKTGSLTIDGVEVTWLKKRVINGAVNRIKPVLNQERFDADKIGTSVVLRHWRPGDRFQPIGLSSPAKLQDLFANQKIPRAQRHQLIVGETSAGEIFWVEGLRMAERFKLDSGTRQQLQWGWKRL